MSDSFHTTCEPACLTGRSLTQKIASQTDLLSKSVLWGHFPQIPYPFTYPSIHPSMMRFIVVVAFLIATIAANCAQVVVAAFLPTTTAPSVSCRRRCPTTTISPMAFDVSAVDTFYQTQPYVAAFLTCSVKASAADLVAQKQQSAQNNNIDISRNLAFLAYGGIWQGMFQQFLFTALYPLLFSGTNDNDSSSFQAIFEQVVFDTTIMGPMICLPIVYTIKNLFRTANLSQETVMEALTSYYNHVTTKGLLTTYWSIWIPAQFATFGLVPSHLRVLFVAAVSFFWVTKLSAISALDQEEHDDNDDNKLRNDFKVKAHKVN